MTAKRLQPLFYVLIVLSLLLPQPASAVASRAATGPAVRQSSANGDEPLPTLPTVKNSAGKEEEQDLALQRNEWFYSLRAAGDPNGTYTFGDVAQWRAQAAGSRLSGSNQTNAPTALNGYGGSWSAVGPNPIVQVGRTADQPFLAMAGRIGALAIRSTAPYTMYLGGAQGGVWISSTLTTQWIPKTDQLPSLAIGAIALAPSNENIVYVGTGEGALSGDSYFGNGVLKSTDAGNTFTHVGANTFDQVSISKIVVDPTKPDHLYLAALSGVAGRVSVRATSASLYGIWESTDGGNNWTGRNTTSDRLHGATDLVMDPQNPQVLYASFWGSGIQKSTDGGVTWNPAMNGLPATADYSLAPTRFALGISHPSGAPHATLYTGFEWYDIAFNYNKSSIYKSTDDGATWTQTSTAGVLDYCGNQCWYDNVIGVDPSNPNIVFALGLFNYDTGTGGVFRSMDGGATWVDLGYHQHPDFHAFATRSDAPGHVMIGNDGGVWASDHYGGRLNPGDTPDKVDWVNLNGNVNPSTAAVAGRSGLQIAQFTSIQQNPSIAGRIYGGTQDNGTLRKSSASNTWFDFSSGDGGQVLVDPVDPSYVYGTYYQMSPYRFTDGMSSFFTNSPIFNGLTRSDRSAFYIPFTMDPGVTSRLYLGSYRVYRTDNRGGLWQIISNDLTTGCTNRNNSPTGVACVVTALSPNAGSPALYVGTGDGNVWLTTDATVSSPTWTPLNKSPLPIRPVSAFAVDSSNYRLAYVAYSGFNAATPTQHGHVFKTTDGGGTWTDVSGDMPDIPVNSLVLDPSHANTLYAGTDIGPYVTTDGGAHWTVLGSGFPIVAVGQLNLNPYTGLLRVGSYGRGAWSLSNTVPAPALQIRAWPPSIPLGPNSLLTFSLVVKNLGNAPATGVSLSDTIPANTTFVSAGSGGTLIGSAVTWSGKTVPVGTVNNPTYGGLTPGSLTVTMTVRINSNQVTGDTITDQDYSVTSAEGAGATGSPVSVTLAKAYDFKVDPTSQGDGGRPGQVVTYTETIENLGYSPDVYKLTVSGNTWPTTLWNDTFTTPITQTSSVTAGAVYHVGVKVTVPSNALNASTDTATVKATSAGSPSLNHSASIQTTAVTVPVLLVDGSGSTPGANAIYEAALTTANTKFDTWDLAAKPVIPDQYLKAHKELVWFTGPSYPGPLLPYESQLASYLNGGGRLFLSGMDLLDQSAGTTDFVKNYLHINWDGKETQNDKGTVSVTGVQTNTVTAGLGTIPLNYASLGYSDFSDQITPISPALAAFKDDKGFPDALTVAAGNYKVMFLSFPYEVMGSAAQRAELMKRVIAYFEIPLRHYLYLPAVFKDFSR